MNSTRNVRLETHVETRAGGFEMHVCRALVTYPEGEVVAHEISRWSEEGARREMIAWLRSRKQELVDSIGTDVALPTALAASATELD